MIDRGFAKHKEELSGFRKPTKKEKKYIKNILIEDNILNSTIYSGLSGKIIIITQSIALFVALFYFCILLFGSNGISLCYAVVAWIIINIILYIYSRVRFNDLLGLGVANIVSLFAVRLGIYKVLPCFIVSFENDSTKTRVYIRTDKDDYCSDVLFCNRSFCRSNRSTQDYLLNSKLYLIKSIGGYTLC